MKWNALFLAINAALMGLMWKERQDAEEFGKDPEQVYCGKNSTLPICPHRFHAVEYNKYMYDGGVPGVVQKARNSNKRSSDAM